MNPQISSASIAVNQAAKSSHLNSVNDPSGAPQFEPLLRIGRWFLPPATAAHRVGNELHAWFPMGHRIRLRFKDNEKAHLATSAVLRPSLPVTDATEYFLEIEEAHVKTAEGEYPFPYYPA